MALPQIKTPLSLTVCKRQRRRSSAVPLLLPVQSPAPQCASNNARPVITGACRSRLLGRRCRPFSRKARRGSSHGHPALPCTIRQLSAAFFPGTLSRHSRIFHCPGVYSPARGKSSDAPVGFFIWFASGVKAFQTRAVPVSVKGDPEARQKRQPYPHSEQVIYQKARSYDRFLNFFCQKVVKMRQRFFFLCFRFSAEHSFLCCCVKLIFLNFTRYSVKLFVLAFRFVFLLHHQFHRTCKTRRQISKFWLFILKPRDGI